MFGDARRRVWPLSDTGELVNEAAPWITSSSYYPSQRLWYKTGLSQGFAWTKPFVCVLWVLTAAMERLVTLALKRRRHTGLRQRRN